MLTLGVIIVTVSALVLLGVAYAIPEAQAFTFARSTFPIPDGFHSNPHEVLTVMGRTAYVHRPAAMRLEKDEKAAAIFVLHGSAETAIDMFPTGFDAAADEHGFLVVYPEMKVPGAAEWRYKDDIQYFTALVNRLQENDYNLNASRAYVCGHSAGGTMSLFLQNEVNLFSAAGAVEAAPGNLHQWDMSKPGHPTMVIWNHADPVLSQYAPGGVESAYYNMTISTLRRHGSKTYIRSEPLPTSKTIVSAHINHYPQDAAPRLRMLSFKSDPGTHAWADTSWSTFNATDELVRFFLQNHGSTSSSPQGMAPGKLEQWFTTLRAASMAAIVLALQMWLLLAISQMCKSRKGSYGPVECREPLLIVRD